MTDFVLVSLEEYDRLVEDSLRWAAYQRECHLAQEGDADGILALVAAKYGLTVDDLKGRKRTRAYTAPRNEAMHVLHSHGHSMPAIGRILGGRDHTTIWNGIRRHERRMRAARDSGDGQQGKGFATHISGGDLCRISDATPAAAGVAPLRLKLWFQGREQFSQRPVELQYPDPDDAATMEGAT